MNLTHLPSSEKSTMSIQNYSEPIQCMNRIYNLPFSNLIVRTVNTPTQLQAQRNHKTKKYEQKPHLRTVTRQQTHGAPKNNTFPTFTPTFFTWARASARFFRFLQLGLLFPDGFIRFSLVLLLVLRAGTMFGNSSQSECPGRKRSRKFHLCLASQKALIHETGNVFGCSAKAGSDAILTVRSRLRKRVLNKRNGQRGRQEHFRQETFGLSERQHGSIFRHRFTGVVAKGGGSRSIFLGVGGNLGFLDLSAEHFLRECELSILSVSIRSNGWNSGSV